MRRLSGWALNAITNTLTRDRQSEITQTHREKDMAINQGMLTVVTSWKRQGTGFHLELPEGA
jgi:hypothetical protein